AAAGLPMVEDRKNPCLTTTYGVGELILQAAKRGVKKIIVGLGGSCTNDFGCGAAYACGVRFYDKNGESFMPVGETLCNVERIDISQKSKELDGIEIVTMCDIDNPPYGENGAAYVFARQKGADDAAIELLDRGVEHICNVVNRQLGSDISKLSGGGAAGAMGAGMVVFFGSVLKMGIETVLDTVGFSQIVKDADMVITGEGKIDSQSLRGKVVIGVSRASKQFGVPVIAVVGGADGDMSEAYKEGVTAIFPINRLPQDFSVSRHHSAENLAFALENILRLFRTSDANRNI
ncbi:MAG: glycerate kinase, partial [Ruminococcaceae bacterium]|nr:glycerate kinase [Oscillospiraceae bacterium]